MSVYCSSSSTDFTVTQDWTRIVGTRFRAECLLQQLCWSHIATTADDRRVHKRILLLNGDKQNSIICPMQYSWLVVCSAVWSSLMLILFYPFKPLTTWNMTTRPWLKFRNCFYARWEIVFFCISGHGGFRGNWTVYSSAKVALGNISEEFVPFSALKLWLNKYFTQLWPHELDDFPVNKLDQTHFALLCGPSGGQRNIH